jgi:hypothetical protein
MQSDSLAHAVHFPGNRDHRTALRQRQCREILACRAIPAQLAGRETKVRQLLRTTDPVLVSYVEALLRSEGIEHAVLDINMSVLDGSLGILPRRVVVDNDAHGRAVRLLEDAGLGAEIFSGPGG